MAMYLITKRRNSGWERFKTSLRDIFSQLILYRLILTRKGKLLLDLPLIVLVVLVLIDGVYRHLFPLFVVFLLVLIFECDMRIEKVQVPSRNPENEGDSDTTTRTAPTTAPTPATWVEDPKEEAPKEQQAIITNQVAENPVEMPIKPITEDDYFEIVIEE